MRRLLSLSALLLAAACGQGGSNEPTAAPQAAPAANAPVSTGRGIIHDFAGTPPPDIALERAPDGATETLADIIAAHPGQPVLVNLWATWCAPCVAELPTLDALAADTKGRLAVIAVSQDMEGWQKVTPFFTIEKYPNLRTWLESRTQLGATLQAQGLPLTILYSANGQEIWRYAGDRDWNSAESRALIGL